MALIVTVGNFQGKKKRRFLLFVKLNKFTCHKQAVPLIQ